MTKTQMSQPLIIIQARLGSTRFPGKVLCHFGGKSLLEWMATRLRLCKQTYRVVVAIPVGSENDILEKEVFRLGIDCFRGDEKDVLSRYYWAGKNFSSEIVVRLTADCPLIDPSLVDACVREVQSGAPHSYTSDEFPDGLDVECFRFELLEDAFLNAEDPSDREHVTPYIRRKYATKSRVLEPKYSLKPVRVCVDEKVDLEVVTRVWAELGDVFDVYDLDGLARKKPDVFFANSSLRRNEGAEMNSGQKLWRRAQYAVAGGNMFFSKRPDLFLPGEWPTYFERAKGCEIWDLDGNHYFDFGFMGVGTNILGYGNERVDDAVLSAVRRGNLSTLNAPEEVFLAEELVSLHPWSAKARFTRTGGEAGAVAARLARAATGRQVIAVSGYHGWHDWYLSANLANKTSLNGLLLDGLEPMGVPSSMEGLTKPFRFGELDELEKILQEGDVAAIFMEVFRNDDPGKAYLQRVRNLADRYGAVLVFDECTSGFRKILGGTHLDFEVYPDILLLGKTLGNGYAINAIVGVDSVMGMASQTFMSSVFWTERIGLVAALASIEEMRNTEAPSRIDELGMRIRAFWQQLADEKKVDLVIKGMPALSTFAVPGVDGSELKTVLTQLFLRRGLLASNTIYTSIEHEKFIEQIYFPVAFEVLNFVFGSISDGTFSSLVPGQIASSTFGRLV